MYKAKLMCIMFFVSLFTWGVNAQDKNKKTIIYANESKQVMIVFPSVIVRGTPASNNFKFGFNKNQAESYALLKAYPGKTSNIHVITSEGNIYSFTLQYKKNITQTEYFISVKQAVGNIHAETKIATPSSKATNEINPTEYKIDSSQTINSKADLYKQNKTSYYKDICEDLSSDKPVLVRYFKKVDGVILKLNSITYNRNEYYFSLDLINKSTVDYDVNFISFQIEASNKRKNAASQSVLIDPLYTYMPIKKIAAGEKARAVYVLKKKLINQNKQLVIELNEAKGERNISLPITHNYIIKPTLYYENY